MKGPASEPAGRSALPAPFVFLFGGAGHVGARTVGNVLVLVTEADEGPSERSLGPSAPWDHVGVLAVQRGSVALEIGGRAAALTAGDVAVLDLLCPFRFVSSGCADTLLILPRTVARALAAPSRHGALLRADHPASGLVEGYAAALAGDGLSPHSAAAAGTGLAAVLAGCAAVPPCGAPAALAARLADLIDAELGSVDLSPARLAAGLGLSRAALYRALGGGGGVASLVRERRLDRAFALLSDPGMEGESLGSVARMVGLSSSDQLSQLFFARFGQRAAAVATARRRSPDAADGGRIAAWMSALNGAVPRTGGALEGGNAP